MTQKIIRWSFYTLFFLTPLIFLPFNNELFEYNKMMLTYILTTVIVGSWLIRMIYAKKLILKKTPLDIPLMLFLLSQILSTIFSIDPHTSIWGYYSRSNGGLLSIISYILLFYALVSNFEKEDTIKFLKSALLGGFLVSLYAIPEHFGVSPSCIVLVQQATDACWVQDVQARVFATMGQPNWLAAYLGMLIFPALYFLLKTTKTVQIVTSYPLLVTLYMAFTFTYSRGGTLGLLGGLLVFTTLPILADINFWDAKVRGKHLRTKLLGILLGVVWGWFVDLKSRAISLSNVGVFIIRSLLVGMVFGFLSIFFWQKKEFLASLEKIPNKRFFGGVLVIFLIINILFGSGVTSRPLIAPATPKPQTGAVTQLEAGGTESGQIRLIVWKGAWETFRHYPLFGSGVETFAYSYYQYRPLEHNLVSEWDFLYNKAHNEYLNYLATTGLVGFLAYMGVIVTFIGWSVMRIFNYQFLITNERFNFKFQIKKLKKDFPILDKILIISLLASYISYLIQDFFGFSVVMIALLFYLIPALVFLFSGAEEVSFKENQVFSRLGFVSNLIYKRDFYKKLALGIVLVLVILNLFTLLKFWRADTYYKTGSDYGDDDVARSYNNLGQAVKLNSGEPLYVADFGYAAAAAASGLADKDATTAAELRDQAIAQTEKALEMSPNNVSLLRTAVRTYYQLTTVDPGAGQKTLEVMDRAIKLAPTDPKLLYNKGLILAQLGREQDGTLALKEAIRLKPNYRDAYFTLGTFEEELNDKQAAIEAYQRALEIQPDDRDSMDRLKELGK